ncbi:uncharacterized protein EURHEDRAFT_432825, partial [Aspergillus ruber CBS 135680]
KDINKSSSLETDWKNLRGYYQKITKTKINDEDGSEVRRKFYLWLQRIQVCLFNLLGMFTVHRGNAL